jgi:hypothetical protein
MDPEGRSPEALLVQGAISRKKGALRRTLLACAIGFSVAIAIGLPVLEGAFSSSVPGIPPPFHTCNCSPPVRIPLNQALAIAPSPTGLVCGSNAGGLTCGETLAVAYASNGVSPGDLLYGLDPRTARFNGTTEFTIAFEASTGCTSANFMDTGRGYSSLFPTAANGSCPAGSIRTPFLPGDHLLVTIQTNATAFASSGGYEFSMDGSGYEFTAGLLVWLS